MVRVVCSTPAAVPSLETASMVGLKWKK